MPFLTKKTNKLTKTSTGADYRGNISVLKDTLRIVTAAEEASKVMAPGFMYTVGNNSLEVYVNGHLKRVVETIDGTDYGDYEETSNGSVTFQAGVIQEGWQVRFRVTANSYDYSNMNTNNINQIGKDQFGDSYVLQGSAIRSDRTIGIITTGTTPDISDYRTYELTLGAATDITDFTGGKSDDIRFFIFTNGNATIKHGTTIKLASGSDFNGTANDVLQLIYDGTVWYEVCRSVNG